MTDDDLTRLRDEVAGVLLRKFQTPETKWARRDLMQSALEDADALLPLLARKIAEARGEALREAADDWTQGQWSDVMLPKPTPPAVPVIAYANRMGDWLRKRAAAIEDATHAAYRSCGCPGRGGCNCGAPDERADPTAHRPFIDDGVTYCGWATDHGVIDGCGEVWPCSTVRAALAEPTGPETTQNGPCAPISGPNSPRRVSADHRDATDPEETK